MLKVIALCAAIALVPSIPAMASGMPTAIEQAVDTVLPEFPQAVTQKTTQTATQSVMAAHPAVLGRTEGTIYIGDSRTNGMEMYVKRGEGYVVAKDSMGYRWLKGDAMAEVGRIRAEHPETQRWTLAVNLGVNDLHNIGKYISFYQGLEKAGYRVVVVSVNPTDGRENSLNSDIDRFNETMKASGLEYLDLCAHLRKQGFKTVDGLHYNKNTYIEIWNEVNAYLTAYPDGRPADTSTGTAQAVDKPEYNSWYCLQAAGAEP